MSHVCWNCGGYGWIPVNDVGAASRETCVTCGGTGFTDKEKPNELPTRES